MSEDQRNKEVHPLISIFVGVLIGMAAVALLIGLSSCGGTRPIAPEIDGRYSVTITGGGNSADLGGVMELSQTYTPDGADVVGDFAIAQGDVTYVGTISGSVSVSGYIDLRLTVPAFVPIRVQGRVDKTGFSALANDSGFVDATFTANRYNGMWKRYDASNPDLVHDDSGVLIDLVLLLPDGSYTWNHTWNR